MTEGIYTLFIWIFGAMTGGLIVFGVYEISDMAKSESSDDEDNLIERERDLKQGQQDIRDEYDEVEDADDLKDVL